MNDIVIIKQLQLREYISWRNLRILTIRKRMKWVKIMIEIFSIVNIIHKIEIFKNYIIYKINNFFMKIFISKKLSKIARNFYKNIYSFKSIIFANKVEQGFCNNKDCNLITHIIPF